MSRGPDAATLLMRALTASAEAGGCPIEIVMSEWTRWASATFAGARHELILTAGPGPAIDRWLEDLPEAEFALSGHIVADVSIESVLREPRVTAAMIEVLTVEAA